MIDRLFISQSVLDRWLEDGTGDVSGDRLTLFAAKQELDLTTAVLFEREVTESGDPHELVGKVKDLAQIEAMGGDYSVGTVIVGDEAYEVIDGFAGSPVEGGLEHTLDSLRPPPSEGAEPAEAAGAGEGAGAAEPTDLEGRTSGSDLASALGSTAGEGADKEAELDLLARFFLEKR